MVSFPFFSFSGENLVVPGDEPQDTVGPLGPQPREVLTLTVCTWPGIPCRLPPGSPPACHPAELLLQASRLQCSSPQVSPGLGETSDQVSLMNPGRVTDCQCRVFLAETGAVEWKLGPLLCVIWLLLTGRKTAGFTNGHLGHCLMSSNSFSVETWVN